MRALFAISLAALLLGVLPSCGSSSNDADDTAVTAQTSESSSTAPVDAEIFVSDEGAGCAVYVSVDESSVSDTTDARSMVWQGLIDNDFAGCDFSEVTEVGLITVRNLDEYNQPDWSTVLEHKFFGVDGWDELMSQCLLTPLPDGCADLLESGIVDR